VFAARAWPVVLIASAGAVAAHVVTFWLAATAAGVSLPAPTMLAVAALVLLVAAVPANLAGWGPREGAAAWAFALVGLDPALGVTAATVFGLLALATSLPGALVLVAGAAPVGRSPRSKAAARVRVEQAHAHG
jgi:glycosyltransferase 2 family protein